MKRLIFLTMFYLGCVESFSQNVGIGITTPLAPLHIKKDNEALRLEGISPYLSFYNTAGTVPKSFIQSSGNNLYLGTSTGNNTGIIQLYANANPLITLLPSGNVGIGTSLPVEPLTVQTTNNTFGISHRGEGGNILATRMGGTSAGIGTFSNTNMRIFSNGLSRMFISAATGNVGIDIPDDNPVFKLDVAGRMRLRTQSDGNSAGVWLNNPANTSTIAFVGVADAVTAGIYGNPFGWGLVMNTNTGNVGIKTLAPANKLQIGSLGTTGFAGNDLAIGNGTAAMGIFQSNTSALIGSTTDIILRPRNNGAGRVGINTNTPRAPLDVASVFSPNNPNPQAYYSYLNLFSGNNGVGTAALIYVVPDVSIISDGRVLATEFNAYSDARIKNITGKSNTAKDLETINYIAITDYNMKDKVKYGNQTFKKVIAQQVEKVYPQVVNKHTDFIPNVYQLTDKITKTANGHLLSFINKHNISKSAKKLQLLLSEGMEQYEIVSIPSENQVIIKATEIKADRVFVYGEEVDDFRTVDYEGLTTLNISATQELCKLLIKQQALIISQQKQLQNLERRLMSVEAKTSNKLKIEKD